MTSTTAGSNPRHDTPAAPMAMLRRRRRIGRVPRSTVALLFVSILLPLVLFGLAARQNRYDVLRGAEHRVERTVRILHEHALKVFETQQLMIEQLNEGLHAFDWTNKQEVAELHENLAHLQALFPQVAAITITDAAGNIRAGSRPDASDRSINLADRDYFQQLEKSDQPLPFISRTVIGKQTHQPIFSIAARLRGPVPGRFDGVISVAIPVSYFVNFYRDNEHDLDPLVVLAREDGSVLASESTVSTGQLSPNAMASLKRAGASNGFLVRLSTVCGAQHFFGGEKVGVYPVYVGFGITPQAALRPWWRNMWGYGLVAILSSIALLGVSGFAIRRVVREGAATVRWRRAASQLEAEMTERAKIEEQLRQSQKMEAVGRLTGGIAHDFNNLLTVVIGSLDLLSRRMKEADARQRTLIDNAVDGATRAAALTSRLLAFSRQHPLAPKPTDPNALVDGMFNMLQRTLGETVSIECKFAPEVSPIYVDPNQLENAILNLSVNAVDAMPKGGTLTIETANVALDEAYCARYGEMTAGDYVMIAVADNGIGMPPDVVARAFEPFYTTKPVGKGTGLGLSQVYGFARQSGGHADIHSEQGRGTSIKLYLPRAKADETAAEIASIPSPASEVVGAPVGATILIVEDDDLVRRFSSTALRDAGFEVVEAASGPEGLARLAAHPSISLLFTDVVLKGPMNGRELADKAAALRPDLPVLFTTGYTKDAIVHQGRLDDGVNFIGKPFTTATLTAKIAALLPEQIIEVRRSAVG